MSNTETGLQVIEGEVVDQAIVPAESVGSFERRLMEMREFTKRNMVAGTDFGIIPGTQKPTLLKPGAEKLLRWHRLVVDLRLLPSSRIDVKGDVIDIDLEGIVRHAPTGTLLGTVHANCNSEERRYFNARRDGKQTLADQKNTILKMANKRAWVAAALLYTMASEAYTQDIEDGLGLNTTEETKCPKCGKGHLVEKKKQNGEPFWVCSEGRYDAKTKTRSGCDYVQWEAPTAVTPNEEIPVRDLNEDAPPSDLDTAISEEITRLGKKGPTLYGQWLKSANMTTGVKGKWEELDQGDKEKFGAWLAGQ